VVKRLEVGGEMLDPLMVANLADISDMDTVESLNIIFDLVTSLLVEGETKKKSSSPRSPSKKG
jgi:hypothetical protein